MMNEIRITSVVFWILLLPHYSGSAPICTEPYSHIEVAEDTPIATVVKEVTCSASGTGSLSYVIRDGNIHGKFGINTMKEKGQVFVRQPISFESRVTLFQLTITVSESKPYVTTSVYVLDIQITGVNDYAPLFLFSPYTVYVNEDKAPGYVISTPIPYDFDKGDDGATTSAILDGDTHMFYMEPQTARVYLRSSLDYEQKNVYTLVIMVTDNGLPVSRSSTTLLTVHVKDRNDNSPVCEETYITESFDETKAAESMIKLLKCTDKDDGNNGRLTYSIESGDYTKFRLQGPYLLLAEMIDVDTEPDIWTLSVLVQDRGTPRLTTLITVIIYVEDIDDNIPQWAPPEFGKYFVDIEEHTAIGTHVVQVSAHDADSDGKDAGVLYYLDEFTHVFILKPTTGEIFVNADIDRELHETYVLHISAVSRTNRQQRVNTDVIINVIDINDNPPIFATDVVQFFVAEDFPRLTIVMTVTATDADSGSSKHLRYRITVGNQGIFEIAGHSGDLKLRRSLDYEMATTHALTVEATDSGHPQRTASLSVIISVLPINEFEPVFTEIGMVSILENTATGATLFQVKASDNDDGSDGLISFKCLSYPENFIVEATTGIVRLINVIDREVTSTYELVFVAEDNSETIRRSTTSSVIISVLDENDHQPECKFIHFVNVSLPIRSGYKITGLNCSDRDAGLNALLIYRITSGNSNGDILITSDGALHAAKKLTQTEYRLQITVSDSGTPSRQTETLIVISARAKPSLSNLPDTISVLESTSVGKMIYQILAVGNSNNLEYKIESVNQFTGVNDWPVRLDKITGSMYIFLELDREETEKYSLDIRVTDTVSGLYDNGVLEIDVMDINDHTPRFEKSLYNISVVENVQVGTMLLHATATDQDLGRNSELNFGINSDKNNELFSIDRYGNIILRFKLDRERNDIIVLTITSTDRGEQIQLTGTATVLISIVDVDEYHPEFVNIGKDFELQLSESTPLGTVIMEVTARDLDVNSPVTYSIKDRLSSTHFLIGRTSGEIVLTKFLDRETRDFMTVAISAKTNNRTTSSTIKINVLDENDNDPEFISNVFNFMIQERAMPGDLIGVIDVSDADNNENGLISLRISMGNAENMFVLLDNQLYLNSELNHVRNDKYVLKVEARDNGNPQRSASASIVILVIPEYAQPKFMTSHEVIEIQENLHIGEMIFDADATHFGAVEGEDGDLMYEMTLTARDICTLDSSSGQIMLISTLPSHRDAPEIIIQIVARNIYNSNFRDSMFLKVDIIDTNDHKPLFDKRVYSLTVNENIEVGTTIGILTANDADDGDNADIVYRLNGNGDEQSFGIDTLQGTLTVESLFDFEERSEYLLNVIGNDRGEPPLSGTAVVHVQVLDVNDNRPSFNSDYCSIYIREDTPINRTIYQFHAADADSGINGDVLYRTQSIASAEFQILSDTGELVLIQEMDREETVNHSVSIVADDKGTPTLSTSIVCTVIIIDVNDNAPSFAKQDNVATLSRHVSVGTFVIRTMAYDLDEGQNAQIQYSLLGEKAEMFFQINQRSGEISTFRDLSTADDRITASILATDRGSPSLSSSTTLIIDIYPSKNMEKDFTFTISEHATPNTFVGRVGNHADYRYNIVGGNINDTFRIIEATGSIFVNKHVDRETLGDYFLVLIYSHKTSDSTVADITVHVVVLDENDNDPIFDSHYYEFIIIQYTPAGYEVGQVKATDKDMGQNGEISYTLDCMKWGQLLNITNNGTILLNEPLMHIPENMISCLAIATDKGLFPRKGIGNVSLSIAAAVPMVNIVENVTSGVISVEIPSDAEDGYIVTTLKPDMFGLSDSGSTVNYITNKSPGGFKVDTQSGSVLATSSAILTSGTVFMWVVAVKSNLEHVRNLALIRIDSFVPSLHVMVLSHEVSLEVLELNRKSFLTVLQSLFTSGRVVIWKFESDTVQVQRKLLYRSSKSYIYVVKDNTVDTLDGIEEPKRYLTQREMSEVLMLGDGDISAELMNERFDNFTIYQVKPFVANEGIQSPTEDTLTVHAIVGIVVAVSIAVSITVAICILVKKKWTNVSCSPIKTVTFNQIQKLPDVESGSISSFKNQNIRQVSSTTAQRMISCLTEEEEGETNELSVSATTECVGSIVETKQLSNQLVAGLEPTNNLRNETSEVEQQHSIWRDKWHHMSNKVMVDTRASVEVKTNTKHKSQKVSFSTSDDQSLSSVEMAQPAEGMPTSSSKQTSVPAPILKHKDPLTKPIIGLANRTIVIAGKEYNGVGKDKTTNQKYFYNTRTGDKLVVTDDLLKRAIQQRNSVVGPEFDQARNKVKFSTFKRPVKRKMSRTRFSTTTIWEMSIDEENEDDLDYARGDGGDTNNAESCSGPTDVENQRRFGVNYSHEPRPHIFRKERANSNISDASTIDVNMIEESDESSDDDETPNELPEVESDSPYLIGPNRTCWSKDNEKGNIITEPNVEESASESDEDSSEEVFVNYNNKGKETEKLGQDLGESDYRDTHKEDTVTITNEQPTSNQPIDLYGKSWLKAGKFIRYARPLYKPMALDHVQCKVPKGKSDPKDCLAKDPIYVGWAKVVGRRGSKKLPRKKPEPDKLANEESLNLEAPDVSAYTKAVANKRPPHMNVKK